MKACALFALAMLTLLPAAVPASTPSDADQLALVVGTLLSQAPQNFAPMRTVQSDSDTDFTSYKVKPFGTHCRACTLYDQYARGAFKETWYVQDRWDLPGKWDAPKTEAYAIRALRGTLAGFAIHRTIPKYGKYGTLTWRGSGNRWVYVDTFRGGYTIRVGHDLVKPLHLLRPPTRSQLEQLMFTEQHLLKLGVPAASANFVDLRLYGAYSNFMGEKEYLANVSFGPMFRKCTITDVNDGLGYKDFQPKWVLECSTVAMAGTEDGLKNTVRGYIVAALPDGFTESTDPNDLLLEDYRWVNQDAMESIDVSSTENNGAVSFSVAVFHYLPKPPSD